MVKAYSMMVFISFVVSCAGTGFFLYAIYSKNALFKCLDSSGNEIECNSISKGTKIWVTCVEVVALLWQLCKFSPVLGDSYIYRIFADFCVVIRRYVDQLEDEQSYKNDFGLNKTSSYYPHQPLDTNHGLLQPQGGYPYTDQTHSYGKTNH